MAVRIVTIIKSSRQGSPKRILKPAQTHPWGLTSPSMAQILYNPLRRPPSILIALSNPCMLPSLIIY